jgi:hypothetical protein
MRKKRPTKAQRAEAAREQEEQNARIRAQHEEAERQVKAREEEERRKEGDAARKTRDEEYKKDLEAAAKKRSELNEKIKMLDVELVALKKAKRETEHLSYIAMCDLVRFPDEEHHAKACDLADKLFTIHNVYEVRLAERELLVAQRDQAGGTWSSVLPMAMGGLAYYIASMFRTTAQREAP